jgi:hypothetical protein
VNGCSAQTGVPPLAGLNRFVKDTKMNTRRLFSRMAQIVILILLIVLAFFLIRGFARGDIHEKKRVYRSEINDFSLIMEKWKEITVSLPYTENIKDSHDLIKDTKIRCNAKAIYSNMDFPSRKEMCG